MAPADVPRISAGFTPARLSASSIPTWAEPSAAPPDMTITSQPSGSDWAAQIGSGARRATVTRAAATTAPSGVIAMSASGSRSTRPVVPPEARPFLSA